MCDPVVAPTKMRPVAVIQHDPVQGPGMLTTLLHQWGIPLVHIQPALGDELPRTADRFSGIALLGSDHSVHDPVRWIHAERALVRDALSQDVPVLGHCFGAQMLASAAGAQARRLYGAWAAQLVDGPLTTVRDTPHRLDDFLMRSGAHSGQRGCAFHERWPRPTRSR